MTGTPLGDEIDRLKAENVKLKSRLKTARAVVDAQAEDHGLWFITKSCSDAYLQQELRKLHAAVEGVSAALEGEGK